MKLVATVPPIALMLIAMIAPREEQKIDVAAETAAIKSVLSDQQKAWNRADIPGFMDGYVRSEKLRFASRGSFRFGWEATLKNYQKGYPNKDAMGKLTFSDLQVQVLSREWAEVFGRWELKRGGEFDDIGGLYTLLLQKTEQGWRVLHDHTSSRQKEAAKKEPGAKKTPGAKKAVKE